jgi:hypothetical protein
MPAPGAAKRCSRSPRPEQILAKLMWMTARRREVTRRIAKSDLVVQRHSSAAVNGFSAGFSGRTTGRLLRQSHNPVNS